MSTRKGKVLRTIFISLLVLIVLAGVAFHLFITRYVPPMVRQRLNDVIVKGSDSLYKFEMGKFDVSFWGGSILVTDLHISVDSAHYKKMSAAKRLPPMTFNIDL